MIKQYSYAKDANVRIQPNFRVKEFRCPDGSDTILVDTTLVRYLQKLRTFCRLSALEVVSGYRTPDYNRQINGSVKSRHLRGQAADVCGYRDGKRITPKILCCAAEILGMGGIALIQTCAHLDVRPIQSKWWGDENKDDISISKLGHLSFFSYFGFRELTAIMNNPFTKPNVTLRRNSRGVQVKWLQFHLVSKNLMPLLNSKGIGNIDGRYGAITEQAVKKLQESLRLQTDGVFGPITRKQSFS